MFIACHPSVFGFKAHADSINHTALAASEAVWATEEELVPKNPNQARARDPFHPLLEDDGSTLSASSIAAHAGNGRILVGAVFSPFFLDCSLADVMAQRTPHRHRAEPHDEL